MHITREDLQFNTTSDHLLDVTAFLAGTESTLDTAEGPQDLSGVQESITHYRGEFLEGFSLRDSNAFDEWVLLKRQQFGQRLLTALRYLSAFYEQRGEYALAQAYARRQIEREPWDEVAHRQLMRTFALSGQRNTALSQYETCCQLLIKELGVEPTQEIKRLYEQILDGHLAAVEPFRVAPSAPPVKLPPISRRRDSSS